MISVVIPTLNEARCLQPLLSALSYEQAEHEVIVADGGSSDGTVDIALANGAIVLHASPGRGAPLRAGAQRACGNILLFIHADNTFPAEGMQRIEHILSANPRIVGGNFRVVFDGTTWFSHWLTRCYAQVRRLGIYYGDSGIFVRRGVYEALGGFRPIALMEDLDFVRRLERTGETYCIDKPALVASSRRFEGRSPAKIIYRWAELHVLFWLGLSPDRLAEIYRRDAPERQAPVG